MSWQFLLIVLIAIILAAAAYVLLVPIGVGRLASHPRPSSSYAESAQRIEEMRAAQGEAYNPICRVICLTHGEKTPRAIVFAHGYTSCPDQFRPLGERFFALGYNVLIAPLPYHGLADRLSPEQGRLRAEDLAAYADAVVDIGRGLGEHLTLAGLSGGGVTTAWAAQVRADLDQAVIISAALGFQAVRRPLTIAMMNVVLALPDRHVWWDPADTDPAAPGYSYLHYSRHALAQIMRLGYATLARARAGAPAAKSIVVVTNAHDDSVDNFAAARLAAAWRAGGARNLRTYEFPDELKLPHDLISPLNAGNQPEVVFPKLIELIA